MEAFIPIEMTFDEDGLSRFNESTFKKTVSEVTGSNDEDVKIVNVQLFQTLRIDGLSQTNLTLGYKESFTAAYVSEFPSLNVSSIKLGVPVVSFSRKRRLGGSNFEIPVTIEISPSGANVVAVGLGSESFGSAVTGELERIGESELSIQEQDATGMEVLFSLKAESSRDIDDSIIGNGNFAAEFAAEARANNIIGTMATVETDTSRIVIVTLAPTAEPTNVPTATPATSAGPETPDDLKSSGQLFDGLHLAIGVGGALVLVGGCIAAWKHRAWTQRNPGHYFPKFGPSKENGVDLRNTALAVRNNADVNDFLNGDAPMAIEIDPDDETAARGLGGFFNHRSELSPCDSSNVMPMGEGAGDGDLFSLKV